MSVLDDIAEVLNSQQVQEGMRAFSRIGMPLELVQRDKENLTQQRKLDMLQQQEMQKQQQQAMASKMLAGIMTDGQPDSDKLAALAQYDPDMAMELYQMAQKSTLPFQGTSMDAQDANLAYQEALQQGLDDFSARKYASDKVRTSRMDMRLNPETGQLMIVPRNPIFGFGGQQQQTGGTLPLPQQGTAPHPDPYTIPEEKWQTEGEPSPITGDQIMQPKSPLADALLKTSGILEQGQLLGRGITAPVDQLAEQTLGINPKISKRIGGEGLARAKQYIDQYTERAVRPMMKTRSVTEKQDLISRYNPASNSLEGSIERLGATVDTLQQEKTNLEKKMQNTQNVVDRNTIYANEYTEVLNLLEEGQSALQALQQTGGAQQPTQTGRQPSVPTGGRFLGFE